ncbi:MULTISPECIES: DUF3139 domain-containing protein [Bacillaceae]|uniref:DUF3139 domain-containing protein n=1 Tax=Bacillaceae TaxID=186817 RepID=UPI000E718FB5|nr:DUF3139 domain-containing protein [Bacillus sp. PK3_68]RJS59286.1 hypothetical protein CJ483_03720 [Bacillus sp. PK3_68]
MTTKQIVLIITAVSLLFLLVPFMMILRLNYGNPYEIYLVNKHVPSYLEKMGYTEESIIEQHEGEPKESSNKEYLHTQYMVKFKDEPDITYYYGVRKKGKIVKQFCERYSPRYREIKKPTKHSEEDCVHYHENQ